MQETYANKDFYLSAFLVASGYRLCNQEKSGGITTFYFQLDEKLPVLIQEYYSMQAAIEPITYGNAIKNLKSVIHSTNTNANTENKRNVQQHKEQFRA